VVLGFGTRPGTVGKRIHENRCWLYVGLGLTLSYSVRVLKAVQHADSIVFLFYMCLALPFMGGFFMFLIKQA